MAHEILVAIFLGDTSPTIPDSGDSAIDVWIALITGLGLILAAAVGGIMDQVRRNRASLTSLAESAHATREQVQNSHSTNLRDDIDGIHSDVRLILASLERLNVELAAERAARIKGDDALAEHLTN